MLKVTIRLVDPLPCAMMAQGGVICGKPATIALAWQDIEVAVDIRNLYHATMSSPEARALWLMQPVCEDCALAAAKVYQVQP